MANDSSTGGPLLPSVNGPQPLEGGDLTNFLQGWFVGLTGLNPTLVRARWQSEPGNIPDAGTHWLAFGIRKRPNDTYAFTKHLGAADNGLGADLQIRHETLDILLSFYDMGIGGQADYYASLVSDGLLVPQNLEFLQINGLGLTQATEPTAVPSLFKERWLYRVDLGVELRRQTQRQYPVRNLTGADIEVIVDDGYTTEVMVRNA